MLADVDDLLRGRARYAAGAAHVPWLRLVLIVGACGLLYGAVMGTYGARALQSLYSSLKVPMLIGVSTAICLPNFFAVNTVLGLRRDFAQACRGVLSSQATLAVTLLALSPITAFAYASSTSYPLATVANGIVFAIAAVAGQASLSHHYAELIRRDGRHRIGRRAWLALYVFVAIQMAWVLRPFIGAPSIRTTFFRREAWGNAYVEVASTVWMLITGR